MKIKMKNILESNTPDLIVCTRARDCLESLWFVSTIFEILADLNNWENESEENWVYVWRFQALS